MLTKKGSARKTRLKTAKKPESVKPLMVNSTFTLDKTGYSRPIPPKQPLYGK
jgi:hypothetical protein